MKINCIIIEDEPLAMERTRTYVQRLHSLSLQACFDNGISALEFLRDHDIDLIFLDINMGDFSGIQLLESVQINSQIIFTTAYPEYALKGFDLNISDYLLKPFTFERFLQSVDRVHQILTRKEAPPDRDFIFIKTEYRLEKLFLHEILFIEGMGDYRKIHTTAKPILTLQTFKDFEQDIPQRILCRVHKSYMVALNKIDSIEKDEIKIRGSIIPVSETYKKKFFDWIHQPPI